MKRMSEVFELPVRVGVDDSVVNASGSYIGDFWTSEMAKAAAHAINSVDALADTLETVLAVISGKTEFSASEIDIDSCYKALNTYRGAK